MASSKHPIPLSPTVLQVIDEFTELLRTDDAIDNDAIDRLDKILREAPVPKPEHINTALFEPPDGGET